MIQLDKSPVSMPAWVFTMLALLNAMAFVIVAWMMTHQQTLMRARLSEQQRMFLDSFEKREALVLEAVSRGRAPEPFQFHLPKSKQ